MTMLTTTQPAPTPERATLPAPSHDDIVFECAALRDMLLAKNRRYGDSALNPRRIFSKSDAIEQIKVRIDDKIARMEQGDGDDEDAERDLIGYLVLLRIAKRRAAAKGT